MKIIFEDGTVVETENPNKVLTDAILDQALHYDNNRKLRRPDYIVVLRGYKIDNPDWMSSWVQFSEVCVYVEPGEYKWVRNWWEGFDAIEIMYINTLLRAGNRLLLYERKG